MKYQRLLIKFSGESFGDKNQPLNSAKVLQIAEEIKSLAAKKIKVAIVCGGGNISRWKDTKKGDRLAVDLKGMKGTLLNARFLQKHLARVKLDAKVYTSFALNKKPSQFNYAKVKKDWQSGKILIFAGGTGYPYFTTDTTAVLFSLILSAQTYIKATKVDGVFSDDPVKNPRAKKIRKIKAIDYLKKNLKVVDPLAVTLARENNLPISVLKWERHNLAKFVSGKHVGSIISA